MSVLSLCLRLKSLRAIHRLFNGCAHILADFESDKFPSRAGFMLRFAALVGLLRCYSLICSPENHKKIRMIKSLCFWQDAVFRYRSTESFVPENGAFVAVLRKKKHLLRIILMQRILPGTGLRHGRIFRFPVRPLKMRGHLLYVSQKRPRIFPEPLYSVLMCAYISRH